MGLIMGVCVPLAAGRSAVLMSPLAFLRKPASWMQQLASHPHSVSAAPNFAFELAVRRTSDADMVDLDLGHVQAIFEQAGADGVIFALEFPNKRVSEVTGVNRVRLVGGVAVESITAKHLPREGMVQWWDLPGERGEREWMSG